MAINAAQLLVKVAVEGANAAKAELEGVGKTSDDTGNKIKTALAGAALAGGAALVGIGVMAIKMAGDFQASITQLSTGAGEAKKFLEGDAAGILALSIATGTTTKQLTDGAFMIASANQHGAQMLDTLKASAEGAKVGVSDLGTVADATTTIMKDYAAQHVNAYQAVNTLIAVVSNGKTHMQDLADSLSTFLPTGAAYKVQLNDMAAAMATMTGEGTHAADAATYLKQTIIGLGSPSAGAAKALKEVGLTTKEVNDELHKSLPGTLQMISDAVGKKFPADSVAYNEAMKAIAGGSKQMQGMLELTGSHLADFKTNLAAITDTVSKGGKSIVGWTDVQKDFNFQLDKAHQQLDVFLIQLGKALIPLVTQLIDYFQQHVMPQLMLFSAWFQQNGVPALQNFGAILGTTITGVTNFVSFLQKGGPAADLVKGAIVGLGLAIAGFKGAQMLVDFNNKIGDVLGSVQKMSGAFDDFVNWLATSFIPGSDSAALSVKTIGTAGETSEGELAASSAVMEEDLAAVNVAGVTASEGVAGIGASAAAALGPIVALSLAVKWILDNRSNIIDTITGVKGAAEGMSGIKPVPGLPGFLPGGNTNGTNLGGGNTNANQLPPSDLGKPNFPNYGQPGYTGGHASGILNNPSGHWAMVGERGPEQMYVPGGATILPNGMSPSSGGGGGGPLQVDVYLDGARLTSALMPQIVNQIRYATGVRY